MGADGIADEGRPRGTAARVGIVLLNLPSPGLGLLRTLRWRGALACLIAPFVVFGIATLVATLAPRADPIGYIVGFGIVVLALVLVYAVAAVWSWRTSAMVPATRPVWSRWYAIVAVWLAVIAAQLPTIAMMPKTYRVYSVPAASMLPALEVGDHFIADMRKLEPVAVGDVIVFVAPSGFDYVKRLVAMPGDRVAMRGGVPVVNGRPARQTAIGTRRLTDMGPPEDARIFDERLPGDLRTHRVLDSGYSMLDDTAEMIVPANHVFVLGDHRDRSADSRVPPADYGVGMVPMDRIRGEALFIRNGPRTGSFGMRLDR